MLDDAGERFVDAVALFLLTAQQRDAFAVFANARQRVAIFGFAWFLFSETATKWRPM